MPLGTASQCTKKHVASVWKRVRFCHPLQPYRIYSCSSISTVSQLTLCKCWIFGHCVTSFVRTWQGGRSHLSWAANAFSCTKSIVPRGLLRPGMQPLEHNLPTWQQVSLEPAQRQATRTSSSGRTDNWHRVPTLRACTNRMEATLTICTTPI